MAKEEKMTMEGVVSELLPNRQFRVKLENDHELLAYLGNKIKRTRIQLMKGDVVEMEISTYDLNRGIITNRLTK